MDVFGGVLEGLRPRRVGARGPRVFSVSRGTRRFRRASDVIVGVPALLLLAALVVAYPPSTIERALTSLLDSMPGWLVPVWSVAYDLLALWALLLVVAAVVARRAVVVLEAAGALVCAAAITVVCARIAVGRLARRGRDPVVGGDRDDVPRRPSRALHGRDPHGRRAPGPAAGARGALDPPRGRPRRDARRAGVAGRIPTAFLVGVVAAAVIRLALGTSAGHPETDGVLAAVQELGVTVETLEPAARQPAGVFVARGLAPDGSPLLVKVYGRDAYDAHLLERLWRTALYRDDGQRLRLSRIEAVEHEALATLLARQGGVATREVVVAAESAAGDALLVLRGDATALDDLAPEAVDDERLRAAWRALARAGAAGIAHMRVDGRTVALVGDEVGLVDFAGSVVAPREDQLSPTARSSSPRRRSLPARIARSPPPSSRSGRRASRRSRPTSSPPRSRPACDGRSRRRTSRWTSFATGSRQRRAWSRPSSSSCGASPGGASSRSRCSSSRRRPCSRRSAPSTWTSSAPRSRTRRGAGSRSASSSRSSRGSPSRSRRWGRCPARLPFVPVYAMQLATGYMNLALPSNFARMAVNIRFFQRQGVPPAGAVTAGAIDSFTSTVIQALLLVVLLLFTEASLDLELETPAGDSLELVAVLAVLAAVTLLGLLLVRRVRTAVVDRVRAWWPEVRAALAGLRASHRLALLVGGSLATELLFACALGLFAQGFGYDVGLADLLLVNISVSLLASFIPIPGGIGVAELGLTVGLSAAGLPEDAALAAALLYRVSTFYLPPVWGFFALGWLRRNALL